MMRKFIVLLILIPFLVGFDTRNSIVPSAEIRSGGPGKDGIPALFNPEFIDSDQASYLRPDDRVLGIELAGEARAYPIRLLNWHELVNDVVGESAILISYCPLCGTGMAFDRSIHHEIYEFGVSGKLYNSDVLFYDKKTDSLWSQIRMEAISGPMVSQKLNQLRVTHTTWEKWKSGHPKTRVLSLNTGYSRDYGRDPYAGYGQVTRLYFPVNNKDSRLHSKDWVLGIEINGHTKAYPFVLLGKLEMPIRDKVGGQEIDIYFDKEGSSGYITDQEGEIIPTVQAYWFAWAAFHPDTELHM